MYYDEIRLETWKETKVYFEELLTNNHRWIFRGHYKARWKLEPSLERIVSEQPLAISIEGKIINEFMRRAHQYLKSSQLPKSLIEWIALMQHHGAPTRLLDWTKSPFVASFIAFESAYKEEGEIAVWAMDASWLIDASKKKLESSNCILDYKNLKKDGEFVKFINLDEQVILPIEPELMNERLTIQQGIFLISSGKVLSFEKAMNDYQEFDSPSHIKKLVIPKSQGIECLTELNRMNISAATLFPGLDGFARSLQTIPDITYADFYEDNGILNL